MGGRANPPIKTLWANQKEAIPCLLERILTLPQLMGQRIRHERHRPYHRLLHQPSRSHSLLYKSHGNSRRIFPIIPIMFPSHRVSLPPGPHPVRKLPSKSYKPGSRISWPIETDTICQQVYPAEIPWSYYLKGFISPIRTSAETWTIHTAYEHSLKHYKTCQENYCPYHQKEIMEPQGSQRRTHPKNDQRLCHYRQPVEAQTRTLQRTDTSYILQEVSQRLSSLSVMDAPPALLQGNQPAKKQKTHATQPQPSQMGTTFAQTS